MQCQLEPEDLKIHYNSYLAAGHISVCNPVSIMSAFEESAIRNFWVAMGLLATFFLFFNQLSNAIGEYPLLRRNIPGDVSALNIIEMLLSDADVPLELDESVTFSMCADS